MLTLILFVFVLSFLSIRTSAQSPIYIDHSEYLQLENIYNLAGGKYWKWNTDYAKYGVPWKFNNYESNNPCKILWQGLYCLVGEDTNIGHIFSLDLTGFNLTGVLPAKIENFTELMFFITGSNNLHGQVPKFINTPMLQMVNFSYNSLSGTVPDDFLDPSYTGMNLIYLSNNFLGGPIPSCVFSFSTNLQYLNLYNNSFTGSLPAAIGNLRNLFYFNVGENKLRGQLPLDALGNLTHARQLFFDHNYFSGPIPSTLSRQLDILWLSDNYFSGSIPYEFCSYSNISVIKMDHNYLTGSLPLCEHNFPLLYILQVQNNQLTGELTSYFSPELHRVLSVLDLSDNAFSGSFPTKLFQLPSLQSLAAAKNCFTGQIPESICDEEANLTTTLEVIALDGLHASSYCITRYWSPFLPHSGTFSELMSGSMPCCLWRLPNITTLHFAGNGFIGTMPQFSSDLSQTLTDVSIAHNRLTGSIPETVLKHKFTNLDLSHNKLHGDIGYFDAMPFAYDEKDQSDGASLNLENNRLSGSIPSVVESAYNIQILQGNIFDCDSPLPKHDPSTDNYMCGSNELDSATLVFGVGIGALLMIVFISIISGLLILKPLTKGISEKKSLLPTHQRRLQRYEGFKDMVYSFYAFAQYTWKVLNFIQDSIIKSYLHPYSCDEAQLILIKYRNVYQFLYSLFLIQKIAGLIAFYTICICFPIYMMYYYVGDVMYSKYEDKYSWVSTSVLLTGDAPAATLLVTWYLLIIIVIIMIYYHYHIHYRKVTTWRKFKSFFGSDGDRESFLLLPPVGSEGEEEGFRDTTVALLQDKDGEEEKEFREADDRISDLRRDDPVGINRDLVSSTRTSFRVGESPYRVMSPPTTSRKSLMNPAINSSSPLPPRLQPPSATTPRSSFYRQSETTNRKSFLRFFSFSHSSSRSPHPDDSFSSSSIRYSYLQVATDSFKHLVAVEERQNRLQYYCLYVTFFLINVVVSISMNAGYLLVENAETLSPMTKEFMQIFMAFFKLIWNIFVIRGMITRLQPYQKSVMRLHVFMLIFNSIAGPCIATAFTDSSCFQEVFTISETISASYEFITCTESTQAVNPSTGRIYTTCTKHISLCFETAFTPSFIYYYTCGSRILTAYIPVFIYTYTILFVVSILFYTLTATMDLGYLPPFLVKKLDGVLRPKEAGSIQVFDRLIKGHSIQALLTQHIIVLLTFGINSPSLAAIMGLCIASNCIIWQMMILRYVKYDSLFPKDATSSQGRDQSTITTSHSTPHSKTHKDRKSLTPLSHHREIDRQVISPSPPLANERISDLTTSNISSAENSEVIATLEDGYLPQPTSGTSLNVNTNSSKSVAIVGTSLPPSSIEPISLSSPPVKTLHLSNKSPPQIHSVEIKKKKSEVEAVVVVGKGEEEEEPQQQEEEGLLLHHSSPETSNRPSLLSLDDTDFFQCTPSEESRLNELHTIIDDAWLCLYHTRWLIVYVSLTFYILILFDLAGDQRSAIHALWVPAVIIGLILITRFGIMDLLRYVQERILS